jgi:hypothetical protein
MIRILSFTLVAMSLAGCGLIAQREQQERIAAVQEQAKQMVEGCKARFSEDAKDAIARAKCFNEADALLKTVFRDTDLMDLRIAKRTELAEQQSRGKITRAQAMLELAELQSRLVTESQRRLNSDRSVRAQELTALAANSPTTCNKIGNSVTCF